MNWKNVLPVVALAAFGVASAPGAVVTLPASKDAMIFGTSADADTNNASGKGPAMFAGADGSSNKKRGLIAFDVASSGIPANAIISDVTLTMYLAQVAGSGGGSGGGGSYPNRTISLYDLQQDWGEGTSGSPTNPGVGGTGQGYTRVTGDSSWDYAFYNSANTTTGKWNAGGPDLHGGNFSGTSSATSTFTVFTTLNAPFTWSGAGLIADVHAWLNGTSNFGWLVKSDNLETSATSFLGFWTKDGAAANNNPSVAGAPSLTITYTLPEPGTISLATVGAISMLRRRRGGR